MMNPWEIQKDKNVWVFLFDSLGKGGDFDTTAHDFATKALDNDKMAMIIIAFPSHWAESDDW